MAKLVSRLREIAATAPLKAGEALAETADAIKFLTQQLAPVDTGKLRDSYEVDLSDTKSAVIGTKVEYAPFVEYGTSRQGAQPHLVLAFAQSEETFKTVLTRKVSEIK